MVRAIAVAHLVANEARDELIDFAQEVILGNERVEGDHLDFTLLGQRVSEHGPVYRVTMQSDWINPLESVFRCGLQSEATPESPRVVSALGGRCYFSRLKRSANTASEPVNRIKPLVQPWRKWASASTL